MEFLRTIDNGWTTCSVQFTRCFSLHSAHYQILYIAIGSLFLIADLIFLTRPRGYKNHSQVLFIFPHTDRARVRHWLSASVSRARVPPLLQALSPAATVRLPAATAALRFTTIKFHLLMSTYRAPGQRLFFFKADIYLVDASRRRVITMLQLRECARAAFPPAAFLLPSCSARLARVEQFGVCRRHLVSCSLARKIL